MVVAWVAQPVHLQHAAAPCGERNSEPCADYDRELEPERACAHQPALIRGMLWVMDDSQDGGLFGRP